MKTLHLSIVVILVIIGLGSNTAFAEMSKSIITVNDTQYEIVFNTVNSTVDTILPYLNSYTVNSLNMNITSDKQYNGSVTLTLTKDAVSNIFCIQKSDVYNYLKNYPAIFALIDSNHEENLRTAITGDKVSLTFDVQAGSKSADIINRVVGMQVTPLVDFKGIPQAGIYRPDQHVIFNGTLVDACGRHLGEEKIYFTAEQLNITKQVTSDTKGKFNIDFTIPEDTISGSYKSKIEMYSKDMNGVETLYLVVEKNGESNIPFLFKTDFGSFEIPYHFDHGEIIDISQYFIGNSLSVEYYATQNGTMEIIFPKELVDLVIGNIGGTTVTSAPLHFLRFPEKLDSDNHRIFDVPVFKGINFISIDAEKGSADAQYSRFGLQALSVENKLYPVWYNVTWGVIQNLYGDSSHKKLTVEIIGKETGGHLQIELPRNIIDSIKDGKDTGFFVTDSINDVNNKKPANYVESQNGTETRTLEINFPQGRNFVEITGTQMVPEFPFAYVVLIIGIASLIVIYRIKYGIRF
jgi:hypothetical protein